MYIWCIYGVISYIHISCFSVFLEGNSISILWYMRLFAYMRVLV
jgi:hypothetical protein